MDETNKEIKLPPKENGSDKIWFAQGAHITVGIIALVISCLIYTTEKDTLEALLTTFFNILHIGCFSMNFGMQFWKTFIEGLTLMKVLPRHTFGLAQSKLFPKYFTIGVVLSGITMISYLARHQNKWLFHEKVQGAALAVTLLSQVTNCLFITPKMLLRMLCMHAIEKKEGLGDKIGNAEIKQSVALKENKEYCKLKKDFFNLHGYSALLNIGSFAGCIVHLYHLAKIIVI